MYRPHIRQSAETHFRWTIHPEHTIHLLDDRTVSDVTSRMALERKRSAVAKVVGYDRAQYAGWGLAIGQEGAPPHNLIQRNSHR